MACSARNLRGLRGPKWKLRSSSCTHRVPASFEGITAYKNYGRGVWTRGYMHMITNAKLIDNQVGAFEAGAY